MGQLMELGRVTKTAELFYVSQKHDRHIASGKNISACKLNHAGVDGETVNWRVANLHKRTGFVAGLLRKASVEERLTWNMDHLLPFSYSNPFARVPIVYLWVVSVRSLTAAGQYNSPFSLQ
uniref:Uncharacterized protein n=1 Tax=Paramormyrops kingsleyae TaxID=1676925 RepID=A0A3B3QX13_9TELE